MFDRTQIRNYVEVRPDDVATFLPSYHGDWKLLGESPDYVIQAHRPSPSSVRNTAVDVILRPSHQKGSLANCVSSTALSTLHR